MAVGDSQLIGEVQITLSKGGDFTVKNVCDWQEMVWINNSVSCDT